MPNIVGVDIGCGMHILNLGKLGEIDYHALHEHIRGNVPSGMIVREYADFELYYDSKSLI